MSTPKPDNSNNEAISAFQKEEKANLHCQKLVTHAARTIIYILHKFKFVVYSRMCHVCTVGRRKKVGLAFLVQI